MKTEFHENPRKGLASDARTDGRVLHMKSSSWLRKEPLKVRCLGGLPCITLKPSSVKITQLVKEIVFSYLTTWVSVLLFTLSYIQIKHVSY